MIKTKIFIFLLIFLLGSYNPAHAGIIDDVFGKVKSIFNGVGEIIDDTKSLQNKADDLKNRSVELRNKANETINKVDDGFNEIPMFLDDLYGNVLSIVNGVDPKIVANAIIREFQNESNCIDLPSRLDEISNLILDNSGVYDLNIPNEVKNALSAVNFNELSIIGIDPATATGEDLYYYKITTVKPLETMKGITGSIFKIPFVIGAEIANACANVAEFRIGQRDSVAALDAQIHRVLSTEGVNNIQFHLPESAGGYLESVESLVGGIMETYGDLEIPVSHGVQHTFAKGKRYYQMGQYHRAFKAYKRAYKGLSGGGSHH